MPANYNYLPAGKAAAWLGIGIGTLRRWQNKGYGPPSAAITEVSDKTGKNRVVYLYRISDLETWMERATGPERSLPPERLGPREGTLYGQRFRFRDDPRNRYVSDEQAARDFIRHVLTPPGGPPLPKGFVFATGNAVIEFVKTFAAKIPTVPAEPSNPNRRPA